MKFQLIINVNGVYANMLNILILDKYGNKYDNKYDNKIIIDVYNFYKYKYNLSVLSRGLYINRFDNLYFTISSNIYDENIDLLINNLYIEYVSLDDINSNSNNDLLTNFTPKFVADYNKLECKYLNNNDNLFEFEFPKMHINMLYISIYIEDNDDVIEDIILNDEFSVSFHNLYILNKLIYVIPLTYDLLENLENIYYYFTNNMIFNEDNIIYKPNHFFFKVITNKNINTSNIYINSIYMY
jgi:hypothetical protein